MKTDVDSVGLAIMTVGLCLAGALLVTAVGVIVFGIGRPAPRDYSVEGQRKQIDARMPECKKQERTEVFTGTVRDISFFQSHSERSGKTSHTVPDKWWLNVCKGDERGECTTVKIANAPWAWQGVGSVIDLEWTYKCSEYGWGHWHGPQIKPNAG